MEANSSRNELNSIEIELGRTDALGPPNEILNETTPAIEPTRFDLLDYFAHH